MPRAVDVFCMEWTSPNDERRSHGANALPRKFLSIWYRCCHTYGRLNRNQDGTAYEGRCPRCGASARAIIGPGGSNQRMFEAR